MARPLRIDVAGGWYHVMSRGIERRSIFLDDSYCLHFLDLLGEMSLRYDIEVHVYTLMGNHYHLIVRTPEANLSAAMQWLNVSYGAWFNAKQRRVGHIFQGRFRSTLIDGDGGWLLDVSAYVHLNPVRVSALGLGKRANKAEAEGLVAPDRSKIEQRLLTLRSHRWSSYRAYGNYGKAPDWLFTKELLQRSGGRAEYRRFVQGYVTRGLDPKEFETLTEHVAIGGREFLEKAKSMVASISGEQPDRAFVSSNVPFERVMAIVEQEKRESWDDFRNRYGDWGCAMVLYLARMRSGLTLREIGDAAGGMEYKTVSTSVRRFKARLAREPVIKRLAERLLAELANVET